MVPPTVVVIGCGPGGMFFLHALETRRRELQKKGDEEGIEALPRVTCFDRASGPGGVWRAKRKFHSSAPEDDSPAIDEKKESEEVRVPSQSETPNMYEALWTNGPKEIMEFVDYTYDDHFGCALPTYMPRAAVLDYFITRVTRHSPSLFDDYVKFNTSVLSVSFDEVTSKFEVVTKSVVTGEVSIGSYDKCIWAGGENGKPRIPQGISKAFDNGKFNGKVIHSSNTKNFEEDVRGKRILLIGGGYSAEDLALMAIKVGVEKIFISHRSTHDPVTWTSAWPMGKVQLISNQVPVAVTDNGRCVQFSSVSWSFPNNYTVLDGIQTEIHDIDTVIFCTGYNPNFTMLEKSLRPGHNKRRCEESFCVPDDWKMKPNLLTDDLGDVVAGDVRPGMGCHKEGIHRGLLISNPSMMYVFVRTDSPLLEIDASCWLFLAFITGSIKTPSREEMLASNKEQIMREMNMPYLRYYMDSNYQASWNAHMNTLPNKYDPRYWTTSREYSDHTFQLMARDLLDGQHPLNIGSYDALNETGKLIVQQNWEGFRGKLDPNNKEECQWKTFRDVYSSNIYSVFTGTRSVPLKKRWMDIDDANDKELLQKD